MEVRKRQLAHKIDQPEVVAFLGQLSLVPTNTESFLVTTSNFTAPAYEVEHRHDLLHGRSIRLLDGRHLVRFIRYVAGSREPTQNADVEPISPNILYEVEAISRVAANEALIIAVANNKGGVAKTTTVLNCGVYLAAHPQQRVLLVDFDGQNSLSYLLPPPASFGEPGANLHDEKATLLNYLRGEMLLDAIVRPTRISQLDILPSDPSMKTWERDNGPNLRAESRFLSDLYLLIKREGYQWVLFDTPPGQGFFARTALATAHYGIIPIVAEALGINPIAGVINTGRTMRALIDEGSPFVGGVMVRWKATKTTRGYRGEIDQYLKSIGSQKFKTEVPSDSQIEKSHLDIIAGKHNTLFNHACPSAQAYKNLVRELLTYVEHPQITLR